ncbi:MAG: HD domain-containing protein [Phycisphaeraceae bacterium]|nr:HD domain-containing protein [Phycisphaerales bacterium]MCB9860025.1 HD domain-containing protein [Phycisphaeraceae bacterium]
MSSNSTRTDQLSISQLQPGDAVATVLMMRNAAIGRTRTDKPYFRAIVADRTGEMQARMWDVDEATVGKLLHENVVWIEGKVDSYNNARQLIVTAIDAVEATPEQLGDLLPRSQFDASAMFAELLEHLRTLEHPAMRALAKAYIEDKGLMEKLIKSPAAKSMHHAVVSGLLEHTLNLLRLADAVCPLYPGINRDIVMMGLFIHDLGKTSELSMTGGFDYTDRGNLVGHIGDGLLMLRDKVRTAEAGFGGPLPENAVLALEHIIASHHGVPEYGAMKLPSTPEAVLVSNLDNLDAKTWMALSVSRTDQAVESPGEWSEKHFGLGTRVYKPDPLAE